MKKYFQCGCCGDTFKSTQSVQDLFNQDVGFGICQKCFQQHYTYKGLFLRNLSLIGNDKYKSNKSDIKEFIQESKMV